MKSILAIIAFLAFTCSYGEEKKESTGESGPAVEKNPDFAQLQGKWIASHIWYEADGDVWRSMMGGHIEIKGTNFKQVRGTGELLGTITRLDSSKNPKELDIKVTSDGNDRGKIYHAIYKLERNSLDLLLPEVGETPPTKFGEQTIGSFSGLPLIVTRKGDWFFQCTRRDKE